MKRRTIAIISLILLLISCRKEADYVKPTGYSDTAEGNFEAFWNGMDQNYIFFAYDPIDWDAVYNKYRPLVNSSTSKKRLFAICATMMNQLIDGHRGLISNDAELGNYSSFNQEYLKKYPFYDPSNMVGNYLDPNLFFEFQGRVSQDDTLRQEMIISRIIYNNKALLYFGVRLFGDALKNQTYSSLLNEAITIAQSSTDYNGLILDVRHNGGGRADGFYNILSRFVNQDYNWGYSQVRLQRDRYTLSPLIPEVVKPHGFAYFGKPIVILTNRYSFSAAEIIALAMHKMPNVTVVGDTTGGANGPISDQGKDYTGNFLMPNGWKVQLAQRITLDANKAIFEGKGVPPEIAVQQNAADFQNGIDNALEAGILYLNK